MLTIGVDLAPFVASGLLRINSTRPNLYGLESHLATIHKLVNEFRPAEL
jgi:circadian clock protein KaiC